MKPATKAALTIGTIGLVVGTAAVASARSGPRKPRRTVGVDVEIEEPDGTTTTTTVGVDVPDDPEPPVAPEPPDVAEPSYFTVWPGKRYLFRARIEPGQLNQDDIKDLEQVLADTGATAFKVLSNTAAALEWQYIFEPTNRTDVPIGRSFPVLGHDLQIVSIEDMGDAQRPRVPPTVAPPTGGPPPPPAPPPVPPDITHTSVPTAPPFSPEPPTDLGATEISELEDPHGTLALARLMLAREQAPGWKNDLQDEVKDWQRTVAPDAGVPDGKFGVLSAKRMAREAWLLPIVRFWTLGQHWNRETALADYRKKIGDVISELERLPNTGPHIAGLRESMKREAAQGSFPQPQPVPTLEQTAQIMDRLNEIDEQEAASMIEGMV